MLLALTFLLLTPPQDIVAATSSPEQNASKSVQLQASTTSLSSETFSSSPMSTDSRVEPVAYEPGRLTPQPVSSNAAPSAKDAKDPQLGTRDVSGLRLPPPPKLRRRIEGSPAQRHAWLGLMIAGHTAATFDDWSTRRAITQDGGRELNPLMKPFAHSNFLYVAGQVSPTLMDYLGHRMMTNQRPWVRRMWWLPQGANTALSIAAGVHNVRMVH